MSPDEIDDMIARAVLGELSDDELATLDAALESDPIARAELDAELATAGGIMRATAEPPPATLKANVLDAIADVAQERTGPTAGDAPVASLDARRRSRSRVAPMLLAAAAVVMLVVGGVLITADRNGGSSTFEAVATAPDAELHALAGTLTGSLRVIHSDDQDAIAVDGADVPVLGSDETYQLWLVDPGGGVRSAGLFRPDDDGRVMQRFDDLDPTGFTLAVTREPAGGSVAPTLPILAST